MLEVADVVRVAGPAYREAFASRMLPSHLRALHDIETCRTAARGGHLRRCDHCKEKLYSYHSCRNRSCPKCHGDQTRRWLEAQRDRLLPCPYFLGTFTLPQQLRPLARSHQRVVYGALLRSAAEALLTLAADPDHLGARPGLLGVLHTWTQAMLYHPHAHFLITGGGFSSDGTMWITPRHPNFLFPGYVLAVLFRAKMRDAFRRAGLLRHVPPDVWKQDWVVHVQHAGSGEKVLDYLARYVFRIAINNSRLERFENGQVTFRYRDRRAGRTRYCSLSGEQFLARFLQHVLPQGFAKVRHSGLYSPTCRHQLSRARAVLEATRIQEPTQTVPQPVPRVDSPDAVSNDTGRCPFCHVGRMHVIATLARPRPPP